MAKPTVDSVMTDRLVTVSPHDPVRDAVRLIESVDIRHLPVVEDSRLVGIISDRDLRRYSLGESAGDKASAGETEMLDHPVSEIMTKKVVSVYVNDALSVAVDAMIQHRIGAIPVVDPDTGGLMGIVSYVDILHALRPSL